MNPVIWHTGQSNLTKLSLKQFCLCLFQVSSQFDEIQFKPVNCTIPYCITYSLLFLSTSTSSQITDEISMGENATNFHEDA